MRRTVPADEAARIYDCVARNWRETTRLLNVRHEENFTVGGVQNAVYRGRIERDDVEIRAGE